MTGILWVTQIQTVEVRWKKGRVLSGKDLIFQQIY